MREKYGEKSVVTYYGLTPNEIRQSNLERFQTKDETRFLVGTPQTGGYGITLTAASTMIYYSNGYDLEKRTQSEARIDRIGQKFPMTYIDILAEDTVDERIVKALRKKINIATQVMGEELKAWILIPQNVFLIYARGTGSRSRPYQEAGYDVRNITLPEYDVREYHPPENVHGVLAAPPCDQ